jgi:hypothetical protein
MGKCHECLKKELDELETFKEHECINCGEVYYGNDSNFCDSFCKEEYKIMEETARECV